MPVLFTLLGIAVFAAAVYLFLVWPALRRHPDRERLLDGKIIAHRGLHDSLEGAPENSLAAFRRAAEAGLAIENDIHLTKDGRVVVFHDDTLDRMCGVAGKPEEKTLSELKELTLAGTGE
ncbi:MAG: glycerophosphodiester phosphodiesterase, partial [Clostridia bacterium]|nr:glycerophosphodiester phosphodiesterase [Clostridia bacterium]